MAEEEQEREPEPEQNGRRSPRVTPTDAIAGRAALDASVQVIDLSAAGALVECNRSLPRDSRLRLEVDVGEEGDGDSDANPLSLTARVVRASAARPGSARFRLGLKFEELRPEQKDRLSQFVTKGDRLERRSTPRIYVDQGARIHKEVVLEVVNLGLHGGLFRLEAPLEFESHHDFVFTLPQGEVHARGRVRHCEAWAGPGQDRTAKFRLGVEFTELDGTDRERVVQYLEARRE